MRTLRVSPLMRRASSNERGGMEGASKGTTKGFLGQIISSWVQDEQKEQSTADLTLQKDSAGCDTQKAASDAMKRTATVLETPLSSPSIPTRGDLGGRRRNSSNLFSQLSDADWAHAQLKQMWDDGELSPRAPLDRSLGYFSSASPVSTGKRSPKGAPEVSEAGKTPLSKHKSQQCTDVPLFINDVRALRQMAPFSSTEEQVLTRSQRRKSSVNLLYQLVSGQPEGLPEFQRTSPLSAAKDTRGRKRRASSPGAPSYPCTLPRIESVDDSDATVTFEGLSRTKGRRRYSPAQGTGQVVDTTSSSSASLQSFRRNSVGTGETARSSSGSIKIASPFQKLPPPSPSDFPMASPLCGSSLLSNSRCSPRCAAAQAQCQQQHQAEGPATRVEKQSEHALTELQKQSHEGRPLGKSARGFHGSQKALSCPFDTQRSLSCSVEPLNSATSPLKSSQARAVPLPLGWEGPCSRKATDQQCSGNKAIASKGSGRLLPTSGPQTLLKADSSAKNDASIPKIFVAIRRSAAPLKASTNATRGVNAALARLKGTSQAMADRETTTQADVVKSAFSPLRTRTSNQSGQTHKISSAEASPIAADDAHQPGTPTALNTPSIYTRKQQCQELNDSTCMALRSCNSGQSRSPVASVAAPADGRRRSTGRRASRLPCTINSPVCLTSDMIPHENCSSPRPALQEASAASVSLKGPGVPEEILGDKATAKSKAASRGQAAWLESRCRAIVSRASPRILSQVRILEAKTADATSARGSKSGSKKGSRPSHASKGGTGSAPNSSWRRPVLAATTRFLAKKLCSETGSSLQQRRNGLSVVGSSKIRALPITKSTNATVSVAAKQQRGNAASATRAKPACTAVCARRPRWHSGRTALEREGVIPAATSAAAVVRQRRQPIQCASPKRRTSAPSQSCTQAPETQATPPGVPKPTSTGSQSELAPAGAHQDSVQSPEGLASASKLRKMPESSPLPHEDLAHHAPRCTTGNSIRSGCAISDKDCMASSTASPSLQCSQRASASSVVFVANEAEPTQWPACRDRSPHEKRRSSDPHHPLSQNVATDALGEPEHHLREPMRRASSACAASISLEQRVTEQQQHDAQQQEWENRDLEYQERQQNLLLEQQKKERLLAWEQREAELLNNRKALSKEEPSFWGFDPFMVDEEDERVLTTEELRVEVSRFLKGDLRFHSRADLLRVVKKFSEQTRTTTTTTSSRLNFAKVEQRVVPMAARQVHGPVPHERRRKSILRSSNGGQQAECRRRSRGISFSPFNKVQLYMLDEHERASKEAAANLSHQGEQRQQMRQKLAEQFQLMLLRGESDIELSLLRRELAELCDPDEEEELAFLSPTLFPGREAGKDRGLFMDASQSDGTGIPKQADKGGAAILVPGGAGIGGRLPFTVSPSWRQRPHRVRHASDGVQGEPSSDWSPSPSPSKHNPVSSLESKEGSEYWNFFSDAKKDDPETTSMEGAFDNDENANCNATSTMPAKPSEGNSQQSVKDQPNEETSSAFQPETAKRPSVLRRRLSIIPNVQSP
ncbi:hypothetical protein Esti_003178 [Eimeria stiedai]